MIQFDFTQDDVDVGSLYYSVSLHDVVFREEYNSILFLSPHQKQEHSRSDSDSEGYNKRQEIECRTFIPFVPVSYFS